MIIRIKRIYEPATPTDGVRVLIDRLWPRGVSKQKAAVDIWIQEIAPSHELRKWFDHDPSKFNEFADRYRKELTSHQVILEQLLESAQNQTLTLLYSAKDEDLNNAVVLLEWLNELACEKKAQINAEPTA